MVYEFEINPVPKPRMTQRDKFNPSKAVLRYWAYKDGLNLLANTKKYKIGDFLSVTFYLPMPKSWPKKKRIDYKNQPHKQKPDLSNLIKAFEDALTDDDSGIWDIQASKCWGETGKVIVAI